ncbi:MAG: type II toxin-antitoxin system RelE/ParE family toxin [Spirochaetes bacterium]|nr:type II toxin-antitoxin system RelE/ParE family toxin [Spirochaetota bacterium]
MYELIIKEQFDSSFSKLKDVKIKKQVWNKVLELKTRAPIGKKLVGNHYWSIHVGKLRIIYVFHKHSNEIEIVDLLMRKHDYKGV